MKRLSNILAIPFLDRDTVLHLRIPFSFYLLPIFCFAFSQATGIHTVNAVLVFTCLHLFIYPASNVYNSYMDKDKGSIGGLENPPPATKKLYFASILFDSVGLLLALLISWKFMLIILLYVGISKAYSWDKIRIKKYAVGSWLTVLLFQGGYTYMLVHMAITNTFELNWFTTQHLIASFGASLLIGGFYPLTQIYQHQEDTSRGDRTISSRLGYTGTFLFSALLFIIASLFFFDYFKTYFTLLHFLIFVWCMLPVVAFFAYWFYQVQLDDTEANFKNTMRINQISAYCMLVCFGVLFWLNH